MRRHSLPQTRGSGGLSFLLLGRLEFFDSSCALTLNESAIGSYPRVCLHSVVHLPRILPRLTTVVECRARRAAAKSRTGLTRTASAAVDDEYPSLRPGQPGVFPGLAESPF
jgi:hypothetical protein